MAQNFREVMVWERTKNGREVVRYDAPFYFYIRSESGTYVDIYGNKLIKLEFDNYQTMKESKLRYQAKGENTYESDISPDQKILSQHYYKVASDADPHISFFDIEVDYNIDQTGGQPCGFSNPDEPYAPISAISLLHFWTQKTFVLAIPPQYSPWKKGPKWTLEMLPKDMHDVATIEFFKTERELLERFYELIDDTDILSAWNSESYDMKYIYNRSILNFGKRGKSMLCFPEAREPRIKEIENDNKQKELVLEIYGREHLDYMLAFKKFEASNRPSYSLESITEEILPELPKLEYEGTLYDLYREDFAHFIRYNIRDSECLNGFEQKLGYVQLAIQVSRGSTTYLKNVLGTLKTVENAIINYCHYENNTIVPDSKYEEEIRDKFTGAAVLSPRKGLHDRVAALDINSLYPSTIMTLNISPEKIIGQFVEKHEAYSSIHENGDRRLHFIDNDGEVVGKTAEEFWEWIIRNNYTVSGYGTVYSQDGRGFLPTILEDWFSQRKNYQKRKNEAKNKMDEILEKYKR